MAKVLRFSFSISLSNEYSGLISFRIDWLDLLAVQGTLESLFSNTTVQKHQFFGAQLYSPDLPGGSEVKASACNAGDPGSIPGPGRFPGEGTGNPLQYSCLENSMDVAWWATVNVVAKSDMTE